MTHQARYGICKLVFQVSFSANAADLFEVWRDRGSLFIAHTAAVAWRWVEEAGHKLERQTYRTGEITSGGAFECTACGSRITLDEPGYVPLCLKCRNSEFRRL